MLWSGSSDRNIRVWELGTGACIATLNATANGGHTEAVTCLEPMMPADPSDPNAEAYVASGGADGELKVWSAKEGGCMGSWSHGQLICSLKAFKDTLGGE
jgi:WD40 repeat protein